MKKNEKKRLFKKIYELLIKGKTLPLNFNISSEEYKNVSNKAAKELNIKIETLKDTRTGFKDFSEWLIDNCNCLMVAQKNKIYKIFDISSDKVRWIYTDDKSIKPKILKSNDNETTKAIRKISKSEMSFIQRAHYAGVFKDFSRFKKLNEPPVAFGRCYFSETNIKVKFNSCEFEIGNVQSELDGFFCHENKIVSIEAKIDHNSKVVKLYKQIFIPFRRLRKIFKDKEVHSLFINYNKKEETYYLTEITYDSCDINSFRIVKKNAYKITD